MKNYDAKSNKKLFYEKLWPYFDEGMVREIYSSDHLCILSLGERLYVACPFLLIDNQPYGIYMNPPVMRKIVKNNRKFYSVLNGIFDDIELNKDLIFIFSNEKIAFWKKWIEENKNVNKMDEKLEKEISLF